MNTSDYRPLTPRNVTKFTSPRDDIRPTKGPAMNSLVTHVLGARRPAFTALAASLSIATPAVGNEWSWLEAACAGLEGQKLAQIEEAGWQIVEPQHRPAIEAMIAARQACRSASLFEAMGSFDADPRAHSHGRAP
jgi:hypothetical protein